jgi:hypothetical protein
VGDALGHRSQCLGSMEATAADNEQVGVGRRGDEAAYGVVG